MVCQRSFDGYRDYVISTLPQLKSLDGAAVGKAEKILAAQRRERILPLINKQVVSRRRYLRR